MTDIAPLIAAVSNIPPGRWAVGVSGGADSVALLRLVHSHRPDIALHVAHLDHQLRGQSSDADAQFVEDLSRSLEVPCTIAKRAQIENPATQWPANVSARLRALRIAFFKQLCEQQALQGVLLAHHADDVAETVFLRLLRGSGYVGLAGIAARSVVRGVVLLRPLLDQSRATLRDYLARLNQPWREDESNQSPKYRRNRVRRVLAKRPELTIALLKLAKTCRDLRDAIRKEAPTLPPIASRDVLRSLPEPIARESARRWLASHGAPKSRLTPAVLSRLLEMAFDAATPPKDVFPGNLTVRRRRNALWIEAPAGPR